MQELEKNEIYDHATDDIWKLAVYDPVHSGKEFANIGGARLLDFVGEYAGLHTGSRVVEFGCGLGATCRYLVTHFGCYVTGIDVNPNQIRHAEVALSAMDEMLASRINFVRSDVKGWQPLESYDVVYTVDTLVLIPELKVAVRKAYEALNPRGSLVLGEVIAGPNITNDVRQWVWDVDGFVSLLTEEEYISTLIGHGFCNVERHDWTDMAIDCFTTIGTAVCEGKDAIIRASGIDMYRSWLEIAEYYQQRFSERELMYMCFAGRTGAKSL